MEIEKPCVHKYRFLETTRKRASYLNGETEYTRVDLFYCTKCLDYTTVEKKGTYDRQPCWWGSK